MKECICGNKFEPKNPKGKYCSDKCKQRAYREENKRLVELGKSILAVPIQAEVGEIGRKVAKNEPDSILTEDIQAKIKSLEVSRDSCANTPLGKKARSAYQKQIDELKNSL